MKASPEQDASLRALLDGGQPGEVIFDPITDNDSDRSCVGCMWSVVGAGALLVGLDAADVRNDWHLFERALQAYGTGAVAVALLILALLIFCVLEMLSANEIYVLETATGNLQLREVRGQRSKVLAQWNNARIQRFLLELPEQDVKTDEAHPCLYVVIGGEQPIRLLEACYEREFVVRVERALSQVCDVASSTADPISS